MTRVRSSLLSLCPRMFVIPVDCMRNDDQSFAFCDVFVLIPSQIQMYENIYIYTRSWFSDKTNCHRHAPVYPACFTETFWFAPTSEQASKLDHLDALQYLI